MHRFEGGQHFVTNFNPFLITVGFVALIVGIVSPETLGNSRFLFGIAMALLSWCVAAAVPWDRFSAYLYWAIPILQFLSVSALRMGGESLSGVGMLAVFPVIWLAWYARRPLLVHIFNFLATLWIAWAPLFMDGRPLLAHDFLTPLLIPAVLCVVGVFAANLSRNIRAHQRELSAKDEHLRMAAAESQNRSRLLDAVIETVPVGVVVVDADGNDLMMNSYQRVQHQLGIPSDVADPREDQLLVFYPDRKTRVPAAERPVRRAIDGESFSHQLIWLGTAQNGRALSTSAKSFQDHKGESVGAVITFNDVTELVTALETKDDFLHNVTHELRTPLTSILGYIDMALEEAEALPESDKIIHHLGVAERNATRLLHLVSDLLTSAAGFRLAVCSADLSEVSRASLESARIHAENTGVTLRDMTPSRLPGVFDPVRIHQVLDNLISNAIKYSHTGDTVTVSAWAEDGILAVRVADTGTGITGEDQQQIFDRFFRTSQVQESNIPGLGLGLSITKSIVDAHGGSIDVTSRSGEGTEFTVRIPASGPAESVSN